MSYSAAVITVSDKGARGERVDTSGPAICEMVKAAGFEVEYTSIVPDEKEIIAAELVKCADELGAALVLTTGGTGFSPRDITPEATLSVIERQTPGIPEAMRAESMRITPRGCLSREIAGIRGKTLIVNLPGSKKASTENLRAVMEGIEHGMDMLYSSGSADCGEEHHHHHHHHGKKVPSMDEWLREAKKDESAKNVGMFLVHNGVVRETPRAVVRSGEEPGNTVKRMNFSYDEAKVASAVEEAKKLPGIYYIRVWLNSGELKVGDDIMYVLVGGDIRPRVISCLESLVGKIKSECVSEQEVIKD